jgi:hypothetical protein
MPFIFVRPISAPAGGGGGVTGTPIGLLLALTYA